MTKDLHARKAMNVMLVGMFIFFVFAAVMFVKAPPQARADGEQSIDIGQTAEKIKQEISAPITAIGVIALIIGGAVFAFSRGNAQKTQQARAGLAAAIIGFLIAVFATGVLGTAKSWISGSQASAGTNITTVAPNDPGYDILNPDAHA